jgi:hypothetical protein
MRLSLGVVTLLLAGSVSVIVTSAPAAAAATASAASDAARAVSYAQAHGYRSSIGVLDTTTGAFSGAGDYNSAYASESVMKVFIATRLLMTGQMSGWNQTTAYKMITQSDDASANALYGRTGGDSVVTWVKQALRLTSLGSPPPRPGWWGGTRITARGMTLFYNAVRHRADVWPWLGNAMHHATVYGSDGVFQFFGLPSATPAPAIKQGWGADNGAGQPAFNSTGYVNGNRYAVAILTQGGVYGTPISNMLTVEARYLMPGGKINNNSPDGVIERLPVYGNAATVTGWSYDRNSSRSALKIVVTNNGKLAAYGNTNISRADINRTYAITGLHGFSLPVHLAHGPNKICVYATNIGLGSNSNLGCRAVTVTGSPVGAVDPLQLRANKVTVSGWTYDYDVSTRAIKAVVYLNGRLFAYGLASGTRSVAATGFPRSVAHGYSFTKPLPDGLNTICVYGINQGLGKNSTLGCRTVRVTGSPLGRIDSITTTAPGVVTVDGWTYDYDAASLALKTVVWRNGRLATYGPTTVARADVNQAFGLTGDHGYSFSVKLDPGANRICVYGINVGAGANSTLGCQSVTN